MTKNSMPSLLTHPASRCRPPRAMQATFALSLAWQWVQSGDAVLVDVRTDAEREWVGFVPGALAVAWKQWPGMALNPDFDQALKAAVPAGKKAVLLCRSGVRFGGGCPAGGRNGLAGLQHTARL